MDRSEVIFTILMLVGLTAVLVWGKRDPAHRKELRERLDVSVLPGQRSDRGAAYLLSNLPRDRMSDDTARFVTE